jgi:hypothetical protein
VVVVVGFVYVEASSKVCLVCHDMQVHVPDWWGMKVEDVWIIRDEHARTPWLIMDESWRHLVH